MNKISRINEPIYIPCKNCGKEIYHLSNLRRKYCCKACYNESEKKRKKAAYKKKK